MKYVRSTSQGLFYRRDQQLVYVPWRHVSRVDIDAVATVVMFDGTVFTISISNTDAVILLGNLTNV